jgi:hypothetical protein
MSKTMDLIDKAVVSGEEQTASISVTGTLKLELDEVVGLAATDLLVAMAFLVAKLQGIYLVASQDLTLETNSGSAPGNTLALKANRPYKWDAGSYFTNKFTVDVTAFYFTNTSGVEATVKMAAIVDAT